MVIFVVSFPPQGESLHPPAIRCVAGFACFPSPA